ncbi:MAG: hypothetical protein SGILL_002680 [Bacillariaceae sp.]
MLTGPKEICAELLKNALARYLVIDGENVATKLLSEDDGHVSFSNVKLVPRKIEWSVTQDGHKIFLLIEGEISKLTIGWKWASFLMFEDASIQLDGLKLSGRILVEEQVDKNFDKRDEPIHQSNGSTGTDSTRHDNPKLHKKSFLDSLQSEYDSYIDSLKDIIPTSTMLHRVRYHIMNILSVTLTDVEFVLNYLEEERKLGKPSFQLIFGMKLFEFLPLAPGSTNGKRRFSTVETHRLVHVGIEAFYMDVVVPEEHETGSQWNRMPVFEPPFTYAAMVRRIYGMRFVDNFYGFEVLGMPTENEKASIRYNENHGITVNLRGKQMQAINDVRELLFGETAEEQDCPADPPNDLIKSTRNFGGNTAEPKLTTRLSKILRRSLYFAMAVSTWIVYRKVRTIAAFDLFHVMNFVEETGLDERWVQRLWLLYHFWVALTFTAIIVYGRKLLDVLNKPTGLGWLQGTDEEELHKNPAVLRLPMAFLTVYAPGDLRVDLTEVSFVGRFDFSVLNLSAESVRIVSTDDVTTRKDFRVEGKDLRMLVNAKGMLLNLDAIHEMLIPEKLRITEPLEGTVVRLENGILKVKLNSIVGVKLNRPPTGAPKQKEKKGKRKKKLKLKVDKSKISKTSLSSRQSSSNGESQTEQQATGSVHPLQVDRKDFIREKIRFDYRTEVLNFKAMARKLEQIPVKTHVHNLRLYKDTFRGSQAVDWILDRIGFVRTRIAAVELARQMQTDFTDEFEKDERAFPFQITLTVKDILLRDDRGDWLATLQTGFLYIKPCPYVGAFDTVISFDYVGTEVFLAGNARIHGYLHPELPHEVHHLQFSVDFLRATKGYSAENWLRSLGFEGTDDFSQEEDVDEDADGGYALPYVYVAPFSLNLVLKGFLSMNSSKARSIRVEEFFGTEKTTSNNLIIYFLTVVLARTPGLIGDVNVMGLNVTEVAGVGTGMTIGATLIPGGQYIALAFIAGADMVRGAIAAGKESRGKPDDRFRPGDIARGIAYMTKEVNRKGAVRRGKSYHDFYNDEDRVNFDPADFAVGAAEETGKYLDHNKARFVGVTVGCMTTVALGVVLTPWIGLGAGVLLGQGTTVLMNFTEKKIKEKQQEKMMLEEGTDDLSKLEKSILIHDHQAREARKERWKRISIFPKKKDS